MLIYVFSNISVVSFISRVLIDQRHQFCKFGFVFTTHRLVRPFVDLLTAFYCKLSSWIRCTANFTLFDLYHFCYQSHKRYSLESKRTFGTLQDFIICFEFYECYYLSFEWCVCGYILHPRYTFLIILHIMDCCTFLLLMDLKFDLFDRKFLRVQV